jgi:hypothetical protein
LEKQKVTGTNCYNCLYVAKNAEAIDLDALNNQGGINPQNQTEMKKAEKADLITLPGGTKIDVINKKFCHNPAIQMYVTIRMCCAYWDNPGVIRPWKKQVVEAQAR